MFGENIALLILSLLALPPTFILAIIALFLAPEIAEPLWVGVLVELVGAIVGGSNCACGNI